jgi:hypothetical protein
MSEEEETNTHTNQSEDSQDERLMLANDITYDGEKYCFETYSYDRLEQAVAYAETQGFPGAEWEEPHLTENRKAKGVMKRKQIEEPLNYLPLFSIIVLLPVLGLVYNVLPPTSHSKHSVKPHAPTPHAERSRRVVPRDRQPAFGYGERKISFNDFKSILASCCRKAKGIYQAEASRCMTFPREFSRSNWNNCIQSQQNPTIVSYHYPGSQKVIAENVLDISYSRQYLR